ncbi:MAG: carboxypeptidase-like regulatory domain-containing protein, partial [Bacteroidota bacterium]|nr:carboxypeptidase-like regulatory domain-containing protein [Bacteroidota bacterium]
PQPGRYGSIQFTFASEGWPQGGMNERGLFFDAAQTPFQEIEFDSEKSTPSFYMWQEILDRFSTVQDAIEFLKQYSIPELSETTVVLADETGDAAIIGVHNHKLDIQRIAGQYMMQSNFSTWHPELSEELVCPRYQAAERFLSLSPASDLETVRTILKKTHQDSLTVYSNIYDLKNKTINTYYERNFDDATVTTLPDLFQYGDCMLLLEDLVNNPSGFSACMDPARKVLTLEGTVVDSETGDAIAYANIGLFNKNLGTLSDPDGSFEIALPGSAISDTLLVSSIGFLTEKLPLITFVNRNSPVRINLDRSTTTLKPVTISAKKIKGKVARLGWMGGKDGVLPLDTVMGGGAVALMVEAPQAPFYVDKLQVRLMYNSRDTATLRFHIYEYDSITGKPGKDLLTREVLLKDDKRFGWMRFDLSDKSIVIDQRKVCIGFEWIDDRHTRIKMLEGLRDWDTWKRSEFAKGNEKVEYVSDGKSGYYKYHGNMMDWPGFRLLPPFTGLMIETGKHAETENLIMFERKTSFGEWTVVPSTLNAVMTVKY